jgi:DNA-directed RNA polymerase sigma subunit (sigma70/sigma32)
VTREIEVALTEEFETTMAARPEDGAVGDANGEPAVIDLAEVREGEAVRAAVGRAADVETALGTAKIQHATRDRGRARELFEQLATLPEGGEERQRIRGELVELHLPLVEYLARRFRNRGEWLDDLTQVATIGLIKSIDRFDLSRGVEFSTYATPTIVGEIKRHFRDKGWAVRVPRRLQELKLALTKATWPSGWAGRPRWRNSRPTCR